MGFDAGSITGHMKLTREEWDAALEEIEAQGEALERNPIEVGVTMDTEGFMEGAEEVALVKDELGQPVKVEVSIDDGKLDAEAAEALATLEALRAAAAEPIEADTGISATAGELKAAADDLANALDEIGAAADRAGGRGLVTSLLDAGVAESELVTALRGLGYTKGDAQALIGQAQDAAEQAAIEAAALRESVLASYMTGLLEALAEEPLALGPGAGGADLAELVDVGWKNLMAELGRALTYEPDWAQVLPALGPGERPAIGPGLGGAPLAELGTPFAAGQDWAFVTWAREYEAAMRNGSQLALPAGSAGGIDDAAEVLTARIIGQAEDEFFTAFAEHLARTARLNNSVPGMGIAGALLDDGLDRTGAISALINDLGMAPEDAEAAVRAAINAVTPEIDTAAYDSLSVFGKLQAHLNQFFYDLGTAIAGIEHVLAGGTGGIGKVLSNLLSGAGGNIGKLSGAVDSFGPGWLTSMTAILAPAIVPILGAVGGALGGALSGTMIGGAGFLDAMIPGLMDLMKGYSAYSAQKALAANPTTTSAAGTLAGLPSGALGVGNALGALLSGAGTGLSGLEAGIYPQITDFLHALTAALPALAPFFQTAVTAMSRFFGVIDKGLTSPGFQAFMKTMTKDLGPIMTEFGLFFEHMGTALGGFLKLFGGTVAERVGGWFDRVATSLSHFLSTVHFGPGFVTAITTVFHDLGAILHTIWTTAELIAKAAAPVGLAILGALAKVFTVLGGVLKDIPVTVLTGFIAAIAGVLVLTKVAGIIQGIGGALKGLVANPEIALLAGGIFLLVEALKTLHNVAPVTAKHLQTVVNLGLKPPKNPTATQGKILTYLNRQGVGHSTLSYLHSLYTKTKATKVTLTGSGTHSRETQIQNRLTPATKLGRLGTLNLLDQIVGHVMNAFIRAWDAVDNNFIHPLAHAFTTTIPDAFKDVGSAFSSWWGKFESSAVGAWHNVYSNVISPLVTFFSQTIPNAITGLPGAFSTLWGQIESAGVGAWHFLYGNIFAPIANFFTSTLPSALSQIPGFFSNVWGTVEGAAVGAWHLLDGNVLQPLASFFTTTLPNALGAIGGFFSSAWGSVENAGIAAWHWLYSNVLSPLASFFTTTLPHAFTSAIGFFKGLPGQIANAVGSIGKSLVSAGESLVNGFITGFDDAINWINSHIPSIFGVKLLPTIPDIPHIGTRAAGGDVQPGMTYLVGEQGPELLQFGASGMISPNSTLRSLNVNGGGSAPIIYISVDARGASNPGAVQRAATSGITATLPRLRGALERGAA